MGGLISIEQHSEYKFILPRKIILNSYFTGKYRRYVIYKRPCSGQPTVVHCNSPLPGCATGSEFSRLVNDLVGPKKIARRLLLT